MKENSDHIGSVECHYQGSIIHVPADIFAKVLFHMRLGAQRFIRYREGARLYSMSENKFRELAEQAQAVHPFGAMVLIDTEKIDEYIEML